MLKLSESEALRKGRRHHLYEMAKNPSLPALIAGGRISISGHFEYLAVDGSIVAYQAWLEPALRFARVATLSPAGIKAAAVQPVVSPDQAKHFVNALLDLACALEGRIVPAKPANVINIAAE